MKVNSTLEINAQNDIQPNSEELETVNTKTSIPDKVAVFNGDQYIATMAKISYNNLRTYREFVDMLNGGLNMYGMHKDNISVTEETYEANRFPRH